MSGILILVSGVSGAGKTTLIGSAVDQLDLHYLRTYTTRPIRGDEAKSHEYDFVSTKQYKMLRSKSKKWDHTEYKGFYYGADVDQARELLNKDHNLICSLAPDINIMKEMSSIYGRVVTIWVNTAKAIAEARIKGDSLRSARDESSSVAAEFDYIFSPAGALNDDKHRFVELVSEIIKNKATVS